MCWKTLVKCSWQKGSLLAAQISVSYAGYQHTKSTVSFQPTYRLQGLLDIPVESSSLESNDLGGSLGVVGNRGTALRAEDAVDSKSRSAGSSPALNGSLDGQLVLRNDGDEGWQMY